MWSTHRVSPFDELFIQEDCLINSISYTYFYKYYKKNNYWNVSIIDCFVSMYKWKINRIIYYKVIHFYKVFTSASMPATCFKHSYSIVTESQSSLFYLFLYVTDEVLLLIKSISKSNDNIAGARAFVEFFLCAEVKKTHLQPPIRQSHLPGSFNWLGIHFSTRKILFFFQLDSNCH